MACYELDPESGQVHAERGWPQLFGDVPLTPTVADVDASTANLEMVVQDRSGWVHMFNLPGAAAGANLPWPEYGHDPRNTFNATASRARGMGGDQAPLALDTGELERSVGVGPNPLRAAGWISFRLEQSERVELAVLDVQGRLIRRLVNGTLPVGGYRIPWDGRTDGGARVHGGIYFIRLVRPSGQEVRRVAIVQ